VEEGGGKSLFTREKERVVQGWGERGGRRSGTPLETPPARKPESQRKDGELGGTHDGPGQNSESLPKSSKWGLRSSLIERWSRR